MALPIVEVRSKGTEARSVQLRGRSANPVPEGGLEKADRSET